MVSVLSWYRTVVIMVLTGSSDSVICALTLKFLQKESAMSLKSLSMQSGN